MVVHNDGGGLRLNRFVVCAVGIARAVDLVRRVTQGRVVCPVFQRILDGGLNGGVDGELDVVAAGAQLVFHGVAVGGGVLKVVQLQQDVDDLIHRVFDVVRVGVHAGSRVRVFLQHMRGRRVKRLLILLVGDVLVFVHAAQDVVGAVVGDGGVIHALLLPRVEIPARIVVVGRVACARQHGAFAERQFAQRFAEIPLRGGVHAVVVFAEVDGVQVAFENLILCVARFQLHGEVRFLNFALVALLGGKERILNQLLGDGRAALRGGGGQVRHERADNALDVHAVVRVEARILHGDKGVLEVCRHGLNRHHDAVLRAFVFGDEVAVGVVDEGGLRLIVNRGEVKRRGSFHVPFRNADHRADCRQPCHQHQHRENADDVDGNRQHEVRLLHLRLENGVLVDLFLLRQRFAIIRRSVPEVLVREHVRLPRNFHGVVVVRPVRVVLVRIIALRVVGMTVLIGKIVVFRHKVREIVAFLHCFSPFAPSAA